MQEICILMMFFFQHKSTRKIYELSHYQQNRVDLDIHYQEIVALKFILTTLGIRLADKG